MPKLDTQEEQRAWQLGAKLTEELRQHDRGMLGARLGELLRKYDATFLSRNGLRLAELLDGYAPELTVIGRSGEDLVWGLGLEEDAPDIDVHEFFPPSDGDEPRRSERGEDIEWLSIEFQNYRSLQAASLRLDSLTVLVGRNGAGKSNILDGLFRTSLITRRKPKAVFSGRNETARVVGRWSPNSGFCLIARGTKDWSFKYYRNAPNEPAAHRPFTTTMGTEERNLPSLLSSPMGRAFGGATYLRLDANRLKEATWAHQEEPFLRHDGKFLPSVLAYLVQTDRARFNMIIERLKGLVPAVEDLRTPLKELDRPDGRVMGNRLEVKMRGVGWIPADQLSEGTLLALGLLTILSRAQAPRLLLLDDVDRGLHPSAQRQLIAQLQEFASLKTKIVCTSHSPYVLDPLPVTAVRVVVGAPDTGATSIYELADHPKWEKWSETMTPADFWQYVGDESWPTGEDT